jgi:hypothetical protein
VTEPTLQQLLDIEAIKQLKARYFRFLDSKQWGEWGMLFTEDCVLEHAEEGTVQHGRETIVATVSAALTGCRSCHHGHMPEIEITGEDTARGTWAMYDYLEWDPLDDGTRVGLQGYGHYREEYVRQDGGWRIARTRLERIRVDLLGTMPEFDLAP